MDQARFFALYDEGIARFYGDSVDEDEPHAGRRRADEEDELSEDETFATVCDERRDAWIVSLDADAGDAPAVLACPCVEAYRADAYAVEAAFAGLVDEVNDAGHDEARAAS